MTALTIAGQFDAPDPSQVLGWVAAASPGLWFLSDCPEADRERVREVLWALCRSGRVEVADWVAGRGQGFRLVRPAPPPADPSPADGVNPVGDPLLNPRPSVVTPLLLVVHLLWFIAGGVVAARTRAASDYLAGNNHPLIYPILLRTGGVSASELLRGGWWRLVTCEFVHVGVFHLLGNMVVLALLGGLAEAVWGRRRFLLIYLLAGLAASVTAMAVNPLSGHEQVVYGSASGGLWGVTAAVMVWMGRNLKYGPPAATADAARRVAVVGVMNLVVCFAQGVSLAGLVGGAVGGLVVASCLARLGRNRTETRLALAGLVGAAVGYAGLLSAAVYTTADWQEVRDRVAAPKLPPPGPPATAPGSARGADGAPATP